MIDIWTASTMGKRGGAKTKATHPPDYYKKIRAKRKTWNKKKGG
jgi:hypothetical protein